MWGPPLEEVAAATWASGVPDVTPCGRASLSWLLGGQACCYPAKSSFHREMKTMEQEPWYLLCVSASCRGEATEIAPSTLHEILSLWGCLCVWGGCRRSLGPPLGV